MSVLWIGIALLKSMMQKQHHYQIKKYGSSPD
jgi:hypothetical protein